MNTFILLILWMAAISNETEAGNSKDKVGQTSGSSAETKHGDCVDFKCEEGWFQIEDRCYKIFNSIPVTRQQARNACDYEHDAQLEILSEDVRQLSSLAGIGDDPWIGTVDDTDRLSTDRATGCDQLITSEITADKNGYRVLRRKVDCETKSKRFMCSKFCSSITMAAVAPKEMKAENNEDSDMRISGNIEKRKHDDDFDDCEDGWERERGIGICYKVVDSEPVNDTAARVACMRIWHGVLEVADRQYSFVRDLAGYGGVFPWVGLSDYMKKSFHKGEQICYQLITDGSKPNNEMKMLHATLCSSTSTRYVCQKRVARIRPATTPTPINNATSPTTATPPTGTTGTATSPTATPPTGTGTSPTATPSTGTTGTGTSPTATPPTGTTGTGTSPTATPPTGTTGTGTSPTATPPTGTTGTDTWRSFKNNCYKANRKYNAHGRN